MRIAPDEMKTPQALRGCNEYLMLKKTARIANDYGDFQQDGGDVRTTQRSKMHCGRRRIPDKLRLSNRIAQERRARFCTSATWAASVAGDGADTCNLSANPVKLMFTELRFRESKE